MPATEEQSGVIESSARRLKVQAFAGTGKTQTAHAFIRARPRVRFLYLVFNKAAQIEAAQRFRAMDNVAVKTIHSVAYGFVGRYFRNKLTPSLRSGDIRAAVDPAGEMNHRSLRLVGDVVTRFLNSADSQISPSHALGLLPRDQIVPVDQLVVVARKLWSAMSDPDNQKVGITHDGYLKLMQLRGIDLGRWFGHIVVDEAQDLNPVAAALIESQNLPLMLIGDAHQQIYRFRGAVNGLRAIDVDETHHLTCAFRYGPQVAILASAILSRYKHEDDLIVGFGEDTLIQIDDCPGESYTKIHRTFAECFRTAFEATAKGQAIGWVGGIQSYPLEAVLDLHHLKSGHRSAIQDSALCRDFPDYGEYRDVARTTEDPEMLRLVRVVEEFGGDVPRLVQSMSECAVAEARADVVVTTAHRAKGLQWSQVVLADDFPDWHDAKRPRDELEDEANLAYVTVTRARLGLTLSEEQQRLLMSPPPTPGPVRPRAGTNKSA